MRENRRVPKLPDLMHHSLGLAEIVASASLLPHPETVASLSGPVFPAIRDQKRRISIDTFGEDRIFLDDNTTPRWAVLWAHGIPYSAHPKGWTFAHVWPVPKSPEAYTHLANLLMMPEFFASLSDKNGPLTNYLQYHSWKVYGWKPREFPIPIEPEGYGEIKWRYFQHFPNPKDHIVQRLLELDNDRTRLLVPLMGIAPK